MSILNQTNKFDYSIIHLKFILEIFSYYTLKSSDMGFNKKIGLFTNYADCNMLPTSKVGEVVEKYNKNSKKDLDEKQKYLNFSGEPKIDNKMKSRFSKFENLSKQRVFSTDFEMKFNKGY